MDNNSRLGPLLIDSLDKPNAVTPKYTTPRKKEDTILIALVIGTFAIFIIVLFFFSVYRLTHEADMNNSDLASYLLWIIYITPIFTLVFILIGGSFAVVRWLTGWADKNKLVSLLDGPHVLTSDIRSTQYEQLFAVFAEKAYATAMKSAENSSYRGVQTLTLDQSTSTSTNMDKGVTQGQQTDANNGDSLYFNVAILDQINK